MTSSLYDIAKKHTVKVCQGSGVLIQPKTVEYSYVLTALHVITDCAEQQSNDICITNGNGELIHVLDIHSDSYYDLAIIKVPYQENLELECYYGELTPELTVSIYGYPFQRSEEGDNEPSTYALTLIDIKRHDILEFRNLSNAIQEDIEGFSGCGFYYFNHNLNRVQLVGIQNQMANGESSDGHIQGYSIRAIHTLINKLSLSELTPPYLTCFAHSAPLLFSGLSLSYDNSLDIVKKHIVAILDKHNINQSKEISPERIIAGFKEHLLSNEQVEKDLHQPQLWVWFLELLSIYLFLSPPNKNIKEWESLLFSDFFKRFRIIYTHKETNFRRLFRDYIAYTDFSSIKEATKIILFANGEKPPSPFLSEKCKYIPRDISRGLAQQQIDTAIINFELNNVMIHWPKLNDTCLAEHEQYIDELDPLYATKEINKLIHEQYNGVLIDDKQHG